MLLYDRDRRWCVAVATWLEPRLRTPVSVLPAQTVTDPTALGLSPAELTGALWWVDVYGRRRHGAAALAQACRLARPPLPVLAVALAAPPLRWLIDLGFRVSRPR
jgi:hypothetical protein